MGKKSREKGHRFERKIAKMFRDRFVDQADKIKRSPQYNGAQESDFTFPGLWSECQDAVDPTPRHKLEQAERDLKAAGDEGEMIPVAITHKSRANTIWANLRLSGLRALVEMAEELPGGDPMICLDLDAFMDLVEAAKVWEKKVEIINGHSSNSNGHSSNSNGHSSNSNGHFDETDSVVKMKLIQEIQKLDVPPEERQALVMGVLLQQ